MLRQRLRLIIAEKSLSEFKIEVVSEWVCSEFKIGYSVVFWFDWITSNSSVFSLLSEFCTSISFSLELLKFVILLDFFSIFPIMLERSSDSNDNKL